MKKILFNDKFSLTQAVLDGRKTQTRRICKEQHWSLSDLVNANENDSFLFEQPKYLIGEVVAVAQSYSEIGIEPFPFCEAGWHNKLFVQASKMRHFIRITDVRVERLQAITDDACIAEGIYPYYYGDEKEKIECGFTPDGFSFDRIDCHYPTPREAYAALIDKIAGKGVWDSNPYVFVYEFELIK